MEHSIALDESGRTVDNQSEGIVAGKKPLESLLVDDVVLDSRSAAFQVGPEAKAEIKTIVVENARILGSKRGISLQLHDSADMHDIWCTFSLIY